MDELALEQELQEHLTEQKSSLVELDAALAVDGSNEELLQVTGCSKLRQDARFLITHGCTRSGPTRTAEMSVSLCTDPRAASGSSEGCRREPVSSPGCPVAGRAAPFSTT